MKPDTLKYYWLLAFILALPHWLYPQTPAYRNYTMADGLLNDNVYSITQDNEGFIWFATDKGASRFDGTHFKNITIANGLTNNIVMRVVADKKGRVWIATYDGMLSYYEKGVLHTAANDTVLAKLSSTALSYTYYEDSKGIIWLDATNARKLYRLDTDNTLQEYHPKAIAACMWENKQGKLRLLVSNGIVSMDDTLFTYKNPFGNELVRGGSYFAGDSVVWLTTNTGVIRCDLEGNILNIIHPANYEVQITQSTNGDDLGNFWLSTLTGMVQFDSVTLRTSQPHVIFPNYSFTCVLRDKEGDFWFSTIGSGVFRVPSLRTRVYDYRSGLSANNVTAISLLADKRVLVGTHSGSVQFIDKDEVKPRYQSLIPSTGGILVQMQEDSKHNTWILFSQMMCEYSADKFTIHRDSVTWYKSLYQSPDSTLWITRGNGIGQIRDGKIYNMYSTHKANRIYSIVKNKEGELLLGTDKGLWVYKNGDMEPVDSTNPLLAHQINALAATWDSSVWIATSDEGLLRMLHGKITHYTNRENLLSQLCLKLTVDSDRLYVITDKGLNILDVHCDGIKWLTYSLRNLLGDCQINQIVRNGPHKFLLATSRGVVQIDERDLLEPTPAEPYISLLLVNDVPKKQDGIPELAYYDNNIQIEFGTIDFNPPEEVIYRYKLDGIDTKWNYTSASSVKYAGLKPGDYQFVVTVKQTDGKWIAQKQPLKFHIQTPWWLTWWCMLLEAVVVIIIALLIISWRARVYREKMEQQLAFAESELKVLRAQINPHFIYNSLNSIQDFVLKNQKEDANLYLTKFAMLMRSILSNSRKATITLAEEITSLKLYLELEALRFDNKFSFHFNLAPGLVPENMEIPSMVLQPYIENAILHGLATIPSGGIITISFSLQNNCLKSIIEDNGIGRKKAAELKANRKWKSHPSLGMQITEERMDMISKYNNEKITLEISDLIDAAGQAVGTRVTICFPENR